MGTLWSALGPVAEQATGFPRVYADANMPAGLVGYMRARLGWDVLFVLEEPDLRRARDVEHYRLACRLRRTIVTLDRDFLDDSGFPPAAGAGVLVLAAPDERGLQVLISRADRILFRPPAGPRLALPLDGRKLHIHPDWEITR